MKSKEHYEQSLVIRWFRLQYPQFHKCLFAIPNGGLRNVITATKLKEEGVLAGVSDLFLMIPKAGKHGMFIEMKAKDGKLSQSQKEFMAVADAMGYKAVVCFGFENAKKDIELYIKG